MKLAAVIFCGACLVTAAVESHTRQRLWVAAILGDLDTVRAELAKGADVNQPLDSTAKGLRQYESRGLAPGATPLMAALAEEHLEIVKVLVANGADLARGSDKGMTPMHLAATGSDEIFEAFAEAVLASAADPRVLINAAAPGHNGRTPLHQVVMYAPAASNIVQKLLDMGGDPTVPLNDGNRLPSVALVKWVTVPELNFNHTKAVAAGMTVIDMLLDAGLDVDTPGKRGVTTLSFACEIKRPDLVALLASRGADPARALGKCERYDGLIRSVTAVVAEGSFSRERIDAALALLKIDHQWPLHTASQHPDDDDVIEILLALGYAIDAPSDCCGTQPLHVAAKSGNTAVAATLLRAGADVNAVATGGYQTSDYEGQRPLDIAREFGRTGVADLLARHGGTAIGNSEDLAAWRRQRSPLDDPFEEKSLVEAQDRYASRTISEALKNGDPNYEVPTTNTEGYTVLHLAAEQGYVDSLRELLRLGADAKALFRSPNQGWRTPLHAAAQYGRARIVEILVQEGGVDVDTLSADNATALCIAVERGLVRTTQSLLSLGANPNVVCYGESTSLFGARKAIIVDKLVRYGADVNARDPRPDYKGYTALLHAAAQGRVDVVRSLLKAGADIEAKCDVRGNAPLYGAAVNNHPKVVEVLLAHGAEVSPVNNDRWTPLGTAASEGHIKVVKALLKAGADPSQRLGGGIGKNSAELALEKNHMDVISAMTRADMAANPRRYSSETNWGPVVAAVLAILGFALIPWMRATFRARFAGDREDQAVQAARDLLRENTAREPRRRNRNAQAARDREAAARRREQARRDREAAAREARRERETAAREAREREAAARDQVRLAREAAEAARSREAAAVRASEDKKRDREAAAEAARLALDREAAAAREREAWEREKLDSLQAMAAWAAASEEKTEEPLGREESKEEPVPEGYEIVARILEHLGEPHLLPIFEAEDINDKTLPDLDPTDLIGLGVSQMTCLAILGAAHSAAKTKKLEAEEVLDNVARHQSVLEEELREHRAEIKRLRIRELPEDLMCPIMCEIMKDPVLLMEDGHTYERVALEQWFATGARTSPSTSAELDSLATAPNHTVKKLIAALLEEHRGRAAD